MPPPSIRRAIPDDADDLARLGALTFTEAFGHLYPARDLADFLATAHSPARFHKDITDPESALWLAEVDGRPVGYAIAGPCGLPHPEVTAASGELRCLYLQRDSQNLGLGGRLFAEALEWLEAAGFQDLWIGVWSENFGAQRFYARHGFSKVGEYGFRVGRQVDHEFILRRGAVSFPTGPASFTGNRHDPA